jgi:hypothetical protein
MCPINVNVDFAKKNLGALNQGRRKQIDRKF